MNDNQYKIHHDQPQPQLPPPLYHQPLKQQQQQHRQYNMIVDSHDHHEHEMESSRSSNASTSSLPHALPTSTLQSSPSPSSSSISSRHPWLSFTPSQQKLCIHLLYIVLFSYLGFGTRYGLATLYDTLFPTTTTTTSTTSSSLLSLFLFRDVFANVIGCFIMGVLAEFNTNAIFSPTNDDRYHQLLSVGLMTGYCGCTTTFSMWQYTCLFPLISPTAAVTTTTTTGQQQRIHWKSLDQFFMRQLFGLCVCLCALSVGHDAGKVIAPHYLRLFNRIHHHHHHHHHTVNEPSTTETSSSLTNITTTTNMATTTTTTTETIMKNHKQKQVDTEEEEEEVGVISTTQQSQNIIMYRIILPSVIVLCLAATIVFIVLLCLNNISIEVKVMSAAFLWSPIGCALRYALGLLNTRLQPKFPLFTLCANWMGTLLVGVCLLLLLILEKPLHGSTAANNNNNNTTTTTTQVFVHVLLLSVAKGFCGCLTTVSSLVEELRTKLSNSVLWRYVYFVLTFTLPWITVLLLSLVIL